MRDYCIAKVIQKFTSFYRIGQGDNNNVPDPVYTSNVNTERWEVRNTVKQIRH